MSYIPTISGFVDFCIHHQNGEPIYLVRGKLYANFDMLVSIKCKYNFTNTKVKTEVEHAIQKNLYMFDILNTNAFYYPNDNMFSMSNAEKNIKGQILTLKKQYTY